MLITVYAYLPPVLSALFYSTIEQVLYKTKLGSRKFEKLLVIILSVLYITILQLRHDSSLENFVFRTYFRSKTGSGMFACLPLSNKKYLRLSSTHLSVTKLELTVSPKPIAS